MGISTGLLELNAFRSIQKEKVRKIRKQPKLKINTSISLVTLILHVLLSV